MGRRAASYKEIHQDSGFVCHASIVWPRRRRFASFHYVSRYVRLSVLSHSILAIDGMLTDCRAVNATINVAKNDLFEEENDILLSPFGCK